MRVFSILLLLLLALPACQSPGTDETYTGRMSREHAGDTPVASAAVLGADTLDVTGEDVVYATVGGVEVTGYLVQPSERQDEVEGPLPGVIVIQEWWGLNDNIRAMAEKVAALGYTVLAVDLYSGRVAEDRAAAYQYMTEAMENEDALTDNLMQAYSYLVEEYGAPRIGSIGWCFGGGWSLRTALALPNDLDAAVIYYGQLDTDPEHLEALQMPILGLFGEDDGGIPVEQVREFDTVLQDLGKNAEIHIYPNANHAFANPSGDRYNAEAAEDAWNRTVAFFAENLK